MADPQPLANGNSSAVRSARSQTQEPEENIFLFYPNLVGTKPSIPILQTRKLTISF